MLVASWNIRGLGRGWKKKAVKDCMIKNSLDMLCLQETKLNSEGVRLKRALWGTDDSEMIFMPSNGSSGGLITLWKNTFFECWNHEKNDRWIVVHGKLTKYDKECVFVNVYAPNEDNERAAFWRCLSNVLDKFNSLICVCGDFNVTREMVEREGIGLRLLSPILLV